MTDRDFAAHLPPAPIHERLGIVIHQASVREVVGTMPVAGNEQPFGVLHGGASVVLAESLGSIGTALHAGPGAQVAGVDVNATHHRPVASGTVRGVATPLRLGTRTASWDVRITDDDGRLSCTARISCIITPPSR